MEFHISAESPDQVVLSATAANRVITIIFFTLAVITLPIGLIAILAAPRDSIGHAIAGFGLFFWGVSRAANRARSVQPAQLVFDNSQGVLRFMQRLGRRLSEQATASYGDIAGFITVQRRDDRVTRYCTALEWRDGSLLILHSHAAEIDARDETLRLTTSVRLTQRTSPVTPVIPGAVTRLATSGGTAFTWQFGFFSRENLTALIAVVGFLYAMGALVASSDAVGMTVVGIFAAIIAAVVGYFAVRWAGAEALLEIGPEIRYYEKRGFHKKLRHSLPLSELDRVLCTTIGPAGDAAIYLLRKNEYAELRKIDLGDIDLAGVASALSLMFHVFKVYSPTLNFSERLRLAWLIGDEISRARGHDSALPPV